MVVARKKYKDIQKAQKKRTKAAKIALAKKLKKKNKSRMERSFFVQYPPTPEIKRIVQEYYDVDDMNSETLKRKFIDIQLAENERKVKRRKPSMIDLLEKFSSESLKSLSNGSFNDKVVKKVYKG